MQQIIAEKSGHNIHRDAPELVIDAIRQVIEEVKPRYRGEVAEVVLRFTDVLAHRDEDWQVVASHATLLNQ